MGFSYNGAGNSECLLSYIVAIIPIAFYRGLIAVSSFLSVIIYVFAYVPIIIALRISDDLSYSMCVTYQIILMMAMSSFFLIDRLKVRELKPFKTKISHKVVLGVTIFFMLYLLFAFRNNLTLSNLGNLYDVREKNDEVIHAGINGYLLLWTQKALIPFLFVIYYRKKGIKSKLISYALLTFYVPIFMMNAQKATILTPILLIGLAKLLNRPKLFYTLFIYVLALLSIVVLVKSDSPLGISIGAILFMRTICICPLLFLCYVKFFMYSPYTYFSHIGIVNKITNMYPYDDILGKVVSGASDNNANAFFWTTDGIASCGINGLVIISVIFIMYLYYINKLPKSRISYTNMMLMFVPSLTALLNSSLFTYFFSHGIFIIVLLLLIVNLPSYLRVKV
jgi:hypothetical protein